MCNCVSQTAVKWRPDPSVGLQTASGKFRTASGRLGSTRRPDCSGRLLVGPPASILHPIHARWVVQLSVISSAHILQDNYKL